MTTGKTIQEIEQSKSEKIMNTIAMKAAYYRSNPHRACELINVRLKWFQKIILWAMFYFNYSMYFASRG